MVVLIAEKLMGMNEHSIKLKGVPFDAVTSAQKVVNALNLAALVPVPAPSR